MNAGTAFSSAFSRLLTGGLSDQPEEEPDRTLFRLAEDHFHDCARCVTEPWWWTGCLRSRAQRTIWCACETGGSPGAV